MPIKTRKIRHKTRRMNKKSKGRTRMRKYTAGMLKKTASFITKTSQPLSTIGKEYIKTKIQDEALQKPGRLSQKLNTPIQKQPSISFKYSMPEENIYFDENKENIGIRSNINRAPPININSDMFLDI